jgi:arylsulfatase A-like enzyme
MGGCPAERYTARKELRLRLRHAFVPQAVAAMVCLLVSSSCFQAFSADFKPRPNVVLILTDDQGYGDFSLHGNPYVRTPHVDRIGQTGVQFERFFVNSFCAPTRAALLTGRYPLRCGVWGVTHNKEAMRLEEVTLAEVLKSAGYRTGCFGKWHNGEQYPYTPPGQGFDEFFGFHNGHFNNYFDSTLLRGARPVATQGYITDVLTDAALDFVRANRQQPFLCYVAFNAPHSPFQVPESDFARFRELGLDPTLSAFYGMVENIDDNVGRLLGELDRLQLTEDTIVVFLTDNGGTAGVKTYNAGMRGGKTSVHEGGTRVPLLMRWPSRWKEPRVVSQIAAHIDVLPTLLDLCGIPLPNGVQLDGCSLTPLLDGRADTWPERTLFTHNPISQTNRYPGAVRTQTHRLVREIAGRAGGSAARENDSTASAWQLYDLVADPGQAQNIAAKHPKLVADLSRQYEAWFDDVSQHGLKRFPLPVGHDAENPVTLHAPQAFFSGNPKFHAGPGYAHDWLTNWSDTDDRITFELDVARAGQYELSVRYACAEPVAGPTLRASIGEQGHEVAVPKAVAPQIPLPHRDEAGHERYQNRRWGTLPVGRFTLPAGPQQLTLQLLQPVGVDFKGVVWQRLGE